MVQFIATRIMYGLVVLVLVTVIVSSIVYMTPVDPARLTFGQRMDDQTVAAKRSELGLDLPLYRQLANYLCDVSPVVAGDRRMWKDTYKGYRMFIGEEFHLGIKAPYLRESYQTGRPVGEMLWFALPSTFILAVTAITFASLIGVALGVLAALNKGKWLDSFLVLVSTLGYSVPSYVTAIVLAIVFGFVLRSYTGLNIQGSLFELNNLGEERLVVKNLILPALALGVRPVSIVLQLTRSSVLQVLGEKYVLAAMAKGVGRSRLMRVHVLRNALNPVFTALSGWFASLLAGAFFVEFIFNFKGLGFLTVTALLNYDIPVILGALLLSCSLFIIINILVDLGYRILDPRIQF